MAQQFDASDLVNWYWTISVPGAPDISINKYLIGGKFGGAAAATKATEVGRVYGAAAGKRLSPRRAPFERAKIGKGTPWDLEHVLAMALDSGAVKASALQGWADSNLGVDCTGFAVAHFSCLGLIDLDGRHAVLSGGASCPYLLDQARRNKARGVSSHLLWDIDELQPDDMVLWMYAGGKESKSPGHISIVVDVDPDSQRVYCSESNGSADSGGHSGPRHTVRVWGGVKGKGSTQYVELDKGAVIFVRTPPRFS